ncbi:MAG: DUF5686 family protein [Paludibacteraceae bacterium]
MPIYGREKVLLEELDQKQMEHSGTDSIVSGRNTAELIAQSMIANTKYHYKKTDIKYSGFLNPAMLSYSTQDGLNYRFRLSFKTHLLNSKSLTVSTNAGYAFKYRDLVADISATLLYNSWRLGSLSLSAGKGNRAFSSLFLQELQDSLLSKGLRFEDVFVDYYKDYYWRVFNSIEVANGFQVGTGIDYHIRQANKRENAEHVVIFKAPGKNQLLDIRRYFVPTLRLSWTPGQYYRREGHEKIYVRSYYPTFKAEYAHCFNGILGSNSEYSRFEFDVNQRIDVGLLQSIRYHAGVGGYSHQQTEYFADFTYFARYKMPETWEDGIGGVFNLLPYSIYNSSTSYAQLHLMYETPFFIFTLFPQVSRGVLSERVYLSQLYTPSLLSYSEVGYGIGNRFVNVAIFGSFHKLHYLQFGAKLVFLISQ